MERDRETLQGEQGKSWSFFFPTEKTREKQFESRDRSEALITSLTNETSSILTRKREWLFVRSFVPLLVATYLQGIDLATAIPSWPADSPTMKDRFRICNWADATSAAAVASQRPERERRRYQSHQERRINES